MPRPPRYNQIGIYHVINRGVERRDIFLSEQDFLQFMALLSDLNHKYGTVLHAFCLMNNHYHLLIETVTENLSEALKHLNVNYSKYFNATYNRNGHLWQGRFKSYPILDETQFWTVAKYIERNPIVSGLVDSTESYPYQSYPIVCHASHPFFYLLESSRIHDMGVHQYGEFIDTPLQNEWIKSVYNVHRVNKDTTDKMHLEKPLIAFFDLDGSRNDKIRAAYRYGYTQSAIADFLGLARMSISKILRSSNDSI